MSESTGLNPRTAEADTEVELSAQDLLALSDSHHIGERETGLTPQPSRPAASTSRRRTDAPRASTSRYAGALRMSLSLIVLIPIVGAIYGLVSSNRANPSTANTSQRTADWPPPAQTAEGEPLRFANPFDTDEVFEFPPGTTETEAREAVAQVLMERAMARQL